MAESHTLSDADFGEDYFEHHVGGPYRRDAAWLQFFTPIADLIVSTIRPRRVLDAGCAIGLLVELLRERGVEAYGFDISSYAIARVPDPVKPYCWQASVADELKDRYDLIVCQEVFPHVAPDEADAAIGNFCRHADEVLFSSMPHVERGVRRHVNFNTPGHYASVFARHDFHRDFAFDASAVTPWAVRYRRGDRDAAAVIGDYEDRLVADRIAGDRTRQRLLEAEDRIAQMERSLFWRVRGPWKRLTGR